MRVKNSFKNIYMSMLTQIVIILLGFISRKVFIDSLGTEYLGVNGLLTNVISMMGLVEGGIGLSIVYNLYKPLAEENHEKVIALIQLYKKIYTILAIVIFSIGIVIYPFLGKVMNGSENIKYIGVVYFLFIFRNMISYFNAHKWSLINADQKGYVLAKYNLIFNIVTTVCKIIILVTTNNYILFLLIDILIFVIQNIWNGKIVNERYSYIKTRVKYNVDKNTKDNLITNVKALFLHNLGGWFVFGTDNILISYFINITTVGLYSNYTMIIGQLGSLLNPIINGIGESVGNLIATESDEKKYDVFNISYFINFWVYSFATIFLYNLLEPFVIWWLGDGLLLDKLTFIVILINFYLKGLRASISIFKSKAGIFVQDKYVPLVESAINLISSLVLIKYLGLAGIFLGTTISTISIPLWTQPSLVYKNVFNKSVKEYFKKYLFYAIITITVCLINVRLCNLVTGTTFASLIIRGSICVIVTNLIYIIIFYRTTEFKYLLELIRNMIDSKFRFTEEI